MTDTFRLLGPTVLNSIAEIEMRLAKASARLDELLESLASPGSDVRPQVTLQLQRANEQIQRALDELEAAENSASGAVEDHEG